LYQCVTVVDDDNDDVAGLVCTNSTHHRCEVCLISLFRLFVPELTIIAETVLTANPTNER